MGLLHRSGKNGNRREWITRKVKDGMDGQHFPFRLALIDLGEDEDGDRVTSCVAVPDEDAWQEEENHFPPPLTTRLNHSALHWRSQELTAYMWMIGDRLLPQATRQIMTMPKKSPSIVTVTSWLLLVKSALKTTDIPLPPPARHSTVTTPSLVTHQ